MINVGLVQPNFRSGPRHLNAYYLPYTLGTLWSYARTSPVIRQHCADHVWIFRRDNIDQAAAKLSECQVVLFSIYVWNKNYCYALAKQLKAISPNTLCVFGGPELPHTDSDLFLKHPYIDSIVVGEGEHAVSNVLLEYIHGQPIAQKYTAERIRDLDIPSPYLEGVFDQLMLRHPDIEWIPTLETDRGCPYKCTFCDWGSLTSSKVTKFKLHRVFAELDWIGEHKLPFLTMTNANFGIYRERDNLIADKIVEVRQATGYPSGISVSYAKNSNADVFNIIKKFSSVGIQNGFILSLQSTTPSVLQAIKRTNMDINDISEIAEYATQAQIPVFTEIILGLPEESLSSFKDSVMEVIQSGLHNGLDIFLLNMIENAPMQQDTEKYQIETFTAYDMFYETDEDASAENTDTLEGIPVLLSNSSMSTADVFDCFMYSWFVIGLHSNGIADILAKYCAKTGYASYREFYDGLIAHLTQHPEVADWYQQTELAFENWHSTGFFKLNVQGTPFLSWQIIHSFLIITQLTDNLPIITAAIAEYVKSTYKLHDDIVNDYILITTNRIKTWGNYLTSPTSLDVSTNLWQYVQGIEQQLEHVPCALAVRDRFNQFPELLAHHVDNILYGRRRNWCLNVVDIPNNCAKL